MGTQLVPFDEYLEVVERTSYYPGAGNPQGLGYSSIAFLGEVGEVANVLKKIYRDGPDPELAAQMVLELGDCYYYLVAVCRDRSEYDLDRLRRSFYDRNVRKLPPRDLAGLALADLGRWAALAINGGPIWPAAAVASLHALAVAFRLDLGEVLRTNIHKVEGRLAARKRRS